MNNEKSDMEKLISKLCALENGTDIDSCEELDCYTYSQHDPIIEISGLNLLKNEALKDFIITELNSIEEEEDDDDEEKMEEMEENKEDKNTNVGDYFTNYFGNLENVVEPNFLYEQFRANVLDLTYQNYDIDGFFDLFDDTCFRDLFTKLFDSQMGQPSNEAANNPDIAGFGDTKWNAFGYLNAELEIRKQMLIHYCKQICYNPNMNRKEKKKLFHLVNHNSYRIDFKSDKCDFERGIKMIRDVVVNSIDRGEMICKLFDDKLTTTIEEVPSTSLNHKLIFKKENSISIFWSTKTITRSCGFYVDHQNEYCKPSKMKQEALELNSLLNVLKVELNDSDHLNDMDENEDTKHRKQVDTDWRKLNEMIDLGMERYVDNDTLCSFMSSEMQYKRLVESGSDCRPMPCNIELSHHIRYAQCWPVWNGPSTAHINLIPPMTYQSLMKYAPRLSEMENSNKITTNRYYAEFNRFLTTFLTECLNPIATIGNVYFILREQKMVSNSDNDSSDKELLL